MTTKTETAAQRRIIYALLCDVAARGAPMPSNAEMRAAAGTDGKIHERLAGLQRDGLISVEYKVHVKNPRRRCIILATGDRTAWQLVAKPRMPATQPHRPIVNKYPLLASRGMSDFAIYGHLAEAVRACRRAGDVVHRNEKRPTEILINGRPKDPKERAAWHARMAAKSASQQEHTGAAA
jgi:hypothetical protein